MSRPFRDRLEEYVREKKPREVDDPHRALAAVALVVAPDPDSVLLIRRARRAGDPWSGQMGLPGGRAEPRDDSLLETARRETLEEVGLLLPAEPLGALDDVAPRTKVLPPIMVRPFVFTLSVRADLELSREVDWAGWIELTRFADPSSYRTTTISHRGGTGSFPGYQLGSDFVWGMTERILTPLLTATAVISDRA